MIAARMGLSTASDRTLWKDKAMTELNLAVLHSFTTAGVTITDHHTESVRFLKHLELEERQRPRLPGGLDLDRAAGRVVRHSGLPPLLRRLRPVSELLPAPGRPMPGNVFRQESPQCKCRPLGRKCDSVL